MKYALTIVALALAAAAAPSANVEAGVGGLEKRQTAIPFRVCQDRDFQDTSSTGGGRCETLFLASNNCHNLGNGYNNAISSAGPDRGFSCTLFDGNDCTGASVRIVHPGAFNLQEQGFNDRASSVRCVSG